MNNNGQTLPPAPILTDLQNPQDSETLMGYFEAMIAAGAERVGRQESRRIATYFHRMSAYLESALKSHPERDTPRLHRLIAPQSLQDLFCQVARHYRSVLVSDTIIMPDSRGVSNGLGQALKTGYFGFSYGYEDSEYAFGFFKAQDVTLSCVTLDRNMMANVTSYKPIRMLGALQAATNAGNHDMLHHFTMEVLNSGIADTGYTDKLRNEWHRSYFRKSEKVENYEGWANITHKRIMSMPLDGVRGTDSLRQQVDIYMDELARIKSEMTTPDRETIDYFGTMMAFTLMRLLPLDHPVMDHCIARMRALEPRPDIIVEDVANSLGSIKGIATRKTLAPVVEAYRKSPSALKLSLRGNATYEQSKRLQLAMITPELSYTICPESGTHKALAEGRAKNAQASLDMVSKVAHLCKYDYDETFPLKPYQKIQKLFGFGIGAQPRREPAPA